MAIGSVVSRNAAPGSSTFPIESALFDNLSPDQRIVMLGRFKAPLFTMLSMGMGLPKQSINSMKFIQISEHPTIKDFLITNTASSPITTTTTGFDFSDPTGTVTDANKLVQIGDKIHIPSDQTNQSTAVGTVAASGEIAEVVGITAAGVATLKRNVGSSADSGNVATLTDVSLQAKLIGPARSETARSGDAMSHADIEDYNYLERFEVPFEVSDVARATEQVGGDPFVRQARQKLNDFVERVEWAMIYGERAVTTANGVNTFHTRGIMPNIAGNTTTYAAYTVANDMVTGSTPTGRIWRVGSKSELNLHNWLTFLERAYSEGSDNKVLLTGPGFHTTFLQNLEGYLTLMLDSTTGANLGMQINAWRHDYGSGVPLDFMVHPGMQGPYSNDAILVDRDYVGYNFMEGMDVREWKGLNGDGLQENDSPTRKHAWAGTIGMNLTYPKAHAAILGMINDDTTFGGPARTVGTDTPSNT